MEVKKNPQVDLEKNKGTFSLIGLVLVLGILLSAFEYRAKPESVASLGELGDLQIEEEIIPITRQQEVKPPPPPPKQKVVEVIEIVEDDVEIEEELEIEDSEADETTEVVEVVEVEDEEVIDEVLDFAIIEDKPMFPGGDAALMAYLGKNTKYPQVAKENNIQGRVYVGFVIDKKGKVTDVQVLRGADPQLDKEAIRVVKSMPSWTPGKQRGKAVKVRYQVPIIFKLF